MPAPPAPHLPVSILVVEDDADQARLMEHLIAANGLAHLATVANGAEALARAPEADVILLDYQLKGPLTGLDVLRGVRQRGLSAAVVITTAHGSERVAAEALRLGADDYLIKDANFTEFLPEVLARVARLRGLERALERAEDGRIRAERRAAIGEIIVALRHELNNPLMALKAHLELLRLDADGLPASFRRNVEGALQQVDRITGLLKRLGEIDREAAKTYIGKMKMTDLDPR